jgi:hypothetical protein
MTPAEKQAVFDRMELDRERAERVVADRERGFCQFCGASIPHRFGEGRCQHCAHYNTESK